MGLSRRATGLSRPEAQLYWRTTHADLFRHVPDLMSYVQNHALLDENQLPLLGDAGFDIFSEVTFSTAEALEAAVASPYYQSVVLPDERLLLQPQDRSFLLARRQPVGRPAPPTGCKLVAILARQAGPCADLDVQNADLVYPVESGSGPIGERAGMVLKWFCSDAEAAMTRHRRNMASGAFADRLIEATIVHANTVVGDPTALFPTPVEDCRQ